MCAISRASADETREQLTSPRFWLERAVSEFDRVPSHGLNQRDVSAKLETAVRLGDDARLERWAAEAIKGGALRGTTDKASLVAGAYLHSGKLDKAAQWIPKVGSAEARSRMGDDLLHRLVSEKSIDKALAFVEHAAPKEKPYLGQKLTYELASKDPDMVLKLVEKEGYAPDRGYELAGLMGGAAKAQKIKVFNRLFELALEQLSHRDDRLLSQDYRWIASAQRGVRQEDVDPVLRRELIDRIIRRLAEIKEPFDEEQLFEALLKLGEFDLARKYLDQKKSDQSKRLWADLAVALADAGQLEEALKIATSEFDGSYLGGNNPQARIFQNVASKMAEKGELDRAKSLWALIKDHERFMRLDTVVVQQYLAKGDTQSAIAEANRITDVFERNQSLLFIANHFTAEGRHEMAEQIIEQAIAAVKSVDKSTLRATQRDLPSHCMQYIAQSTTLMRNPQKCLSVIQSIEDPYIRGVALKHLAERRLKAGEKKEFERIIRSARSALEEAVRSRRHGDSRMALAGLAYLYAKSGFAKEAHEMSATAFENSDATNPRWILVKYGGMAAIYDETDSVGRLASEIATLPDGIDRAFANLAVYLYFSRKSQELAKP